MRYGYGLPVAATATATGVLRTKAIAAIDGPIAPGPERHHGVDAALGADCRMHLAGSATESAAAAATAPLLTLAGRTALGTTTGLVGESLRSEELLLSSGEGKFIPTFYTRKGFV